MADKMININVTIGDRPYRLKIDALEEAMVREAAKSINQKLKEFQLAFSTKDKQDYLAMIAILNTVEGMKGSTNVENSPLNQKVDELDQLLSTF